MVQLQEVLTLFDIDQTRLTRKIRLGSLSLLLIHIHLTLSTAVVEAWGRESRQREDRRSSSKSGRDRQLAGTVLTITRSLRGLRVIHRTTPIKDRHQVIRD